MKQPFIYRRRSRLRHEHGVTMVMVAIAMVAIIAMAAMSIDVITLYLAREEAQRSADTAALAAARVISLSGITGDPTNATSSWQAICGGSGSPATQAAMTVALQNVVGGAAANTVNVTYSAGGPGNADCSKVATAFGVNPMVTVQVQRTNLPNFFSRIWGRSGNTVSASSTTEAFNPSFSGGIMGSIVPVQPSCVKPWMVPNRDPWNPGQSGGFNCDQGGGKGPGSCKALLNSDGTILNPGISLNGNNSQGVIGERLWLVPDCFYTGSTCSLRDNPLLANHVQTVHIQQPPNLEYVPGQVINNAAAVPSCGSGSTYQTAISGCDQSTVYQCGVQSSQAATPNMVDLSENPATSGDTANGVACLINEGDPTDKQPDGQDTLGPYTAQPSYGSPTSYPYQILAGDSNAMVAQAGLSQNTPITSSTSVVSLPIYDDVAGTFTLGSGTSAVTIVGFLQVFINSVDQYGNVDVTVLNVVGCSNGNGTYPVVGNPVSGTSPVPTRIVTPP